MYYLLCDVDGGPQIAQLEQRLGLVDQDVVRLDVGVDDVALSQQLEREEELVRVRAHRVDVDAHVLAVLFQHLPQVHGERLEGEAQVLQGGNSIRKFLA